VSNALEINSAPVDAAALHMTAVFHTDPALGSYVRGFIICFGRIKNITNNPIQ